MKNILLIAVLCAPALLFCQSETSSTPAKTRNVTEVYSALGLEPETVRTMITRKTQLNPEQVEEIMLPFSRVIYKARETQGTDVMGNRMTAYFSETWKLSESQIQDLGKIAARFAQSTSSDQR